MTDPLHRPFEEITSRYESAEVVWRESLRLMTLRERLSYSCLMYYAFYFAAACALLALGVAANAPPAIILAVLPGFGACWILGFSIHPWIFQKVLAVSRYHDCAQRTEWTA